MNTLIVPQRELKKRLKKQKIVNSIVDILKELQPQELVEIKTNPELVLYVCNLVENSFNKCKKRGIDKKIIVLDIINKVTPLTEPEKKIIGDSIQFLHSKGDIKLITIVEKIIFHGKNLFLKK